MQIINNKMYPQLELPKPMIWRISRINHDSWILNPLDNRISPKIPTGKLSFNILHEDPTSVYCFEHDNLFSSGSLREKVTAVENYGHSSLGYIPFENKNFLFDKSVPKEIRYAKAAKPSLLAGHIYFGDDDSPLMGGGVMKHWTNNSGHYRPSIQNAENNRVGFIKTILLFDKFLYSPWSGVRS